MKIHPNQWAFAALFALLTPTLQAQTVRYDTGGFEGPTFSPGQLAGSTFLNGQDGWLATGDGSGVIDLALFQVQTAVVQAGAQAVGIVADGQTASFSHLRRNEQFTVTPAEPVVEIRMDMMLASSTVLSDAWGLQAQAGPGPGSGIFIWDVFPDGHVHILENGAFTDTGFVFTRDTWHHVRTAIDYVNQRVELTVDGQLVANVPTLAGGQHWFYAFASIYLGLPGNDAMYMDDFVVLTRPLGGAVGSSYCVAASNSTGAGAAITGSGSASVAANDLTLEAGPVPNQPGLFYYGSNQLQLPFGNGFRCVGGNVFRLGAVVGSGNTMAWTVDLTSLTGAGQIGAGDTWNFQAWYRDPAAGGAGFNLTDGLELTFLP